MRASSCRTVRGRPDIAHTRTPARWHASSARTPRSVKPPSPSRVTAPPAPSRVPSRSTYRQPPRHCGGRQRTTKARRPSSLPYRRPRRCRKPAPAATGSCRARGDGVGRAASGGQLVLRLGRPRARIFRPLRRAGHCSSRPGRRRRQRREARGSAEPAPGREQCLVHELPLVGATGGLGGCRVPRRVQRPGPGRRTASRSSDPCR